MAFITDKKAQELDKKYDDLQRFMKDAKRDEKYQAAWDEAHQIAKILRQYDAEKEQEAKQQRGGR